MRNVQWVSRSSQMPAAAPQALPPLIWQILINRGILSESEAFKWLSPRLAEIKDPFLIADMQIAVTRLQQALFAQETICIYADYDLDGTSGMALLKNGLEALGFSNIVVEQPRRLGEGYGLHASCVPSLKDKGVTLLVTVDVGITDVETVKLANDCGIDVIITDHHLPKDELPKALAILDPNRRECSSGLGYLCGAGVAFYLVLALKRHLSDNGCLAKDFNPKSLLDCFVIGTLTDMVPLVGDNRVLVKHGLVQLAQTERPGLRFLLEELGLLGRQLTSQDVAIRFAPKINALSRLDVAVSAADLFLINDEVKAQRLVREVLKSNLVRIALQEQAENEAFKQYESLPNARFVWVWSKNFHRGVIGLVATKLAQQFNLPAFVGSECDGVIVGSARIPDGYPLSLMDVFSGVKHSLNRFGGHASAAGFELKSSEAETLRFNLENFFNTLTLVNECVSRQIYFDGIAKLQDINAKFMNWFEHLEPFGADFVMPLFLFCNVGVLESKKVRGGHYKLRLKQGAAPSIDGLWFNPPAVHNVITALNQMHPLIDILAEPQWNYFNGRKTMQLLIRDARITNLSINDDVSSGGEVRHSNCLSPNSR